MLDSFISTTDMGNALLEFIGSDEYKRILACLEDNKESGFRAGVAISVSVMLARCPKYVEYVGRKNNQDPETISEAVVDQEPADLSEANIAEYD